MKNILIICVYLKIAFIYNNYKYAVQINKYLSVIIYYIFNMFLSFNTIFTLKTPKRLSQHQQDPLWAFCIVNIFSYIFHSRNVKTGLLLKKHERWKRILCAPHVYISVLKGCDIRIVHLLFIFICIYNV